MKDPTYIQLDIHLLWCIMVLTTCFSLEVIPIYLEFYKTKRGDNPVIQYVLSMDDVDEVAEIMETVEHIDQEGAAYLIHGGEITRSLGDGLWEIKKGKNRIYYLYCRLNRVYMLHACFKQKGKAELNDINLGKKRMKEIQLGMRMRLK